MNSQCLLHFESRGLSLFSVACISGLTLSFHPFLLSHICTSQQLTPLRSFIRPICFFYLQEQVWIFSINTTYAHDRLKIMFVLHYAEIEDKVSSFFLKVLLKYKGVILHCGFRAQFFLNCFLLDNNRSFGEKCQKMSVVGLCGSSEQPIHLCRCTHIPYTCGGWRFGAAFLSSSSSCEGDFHMTCQLIMFLLQAIQRNTIRAYTEQVTNTQAHGEWGDCRTPCRGGFGGLDNTLSSNVIHSFRSAVAQKINK